MSTHPDQKHLIETFMGGAWGYFGDWNSLMRVIEKISQHVYETNIEKGPFGDGEEVTVHDRAYPRTFGMMTDEEPFRWMFRFNRAQLQFSDTLFDAVETAVIEWIKDYNEGIYNQKS